MSDWTCRTCHATNAQGARSCEACGDPAGERPRRDDEAKAQQARCSWTSPSCPFPAASFPQGGDRPGLCDWHGGVRQGLRQNRLIDFQRWLSAIRYCDVWSHYPSAVLWVWMQGQAPTVDPVPCPDACCPLALADRGGDGVMLDGERAREAMRVVRGVVERERSEASAHAKIDALFAAQQREEAERGR